NRLSPITKFMANNDEKLCLSLEWSNRINLSSSSPSSSSSSIVVSQSDDCKLKGWDIRMDLSTSIFSNT
ncbi:2425_t:CDS:2, partial [Entrophospora sp. SA101]